MSFHYPLPSILPPTVPVQTTTISLLDISNGFQLDSLLLKCCLPPLTHFHYCSLIDPLNTNLTFLLHYSKVFHGFHSPEKRVGSSA